jgi:hypothetical protein
MEFSIPVGVSRSRGGAVEPENRLPLFLTVPQKLTHPSSRGDGRFMAPGYSGKGGWEQAGVLLAGG